MRLNAFAGRPAIVLNNSLHQAFLANELTFYSMETPIKVAWGKSNLVNDPKVRVYLREYEERFPGLFDPAKRKTNAVRKLSRVKHRIDTGNAASVIHKPRHYSPAITGFTRC